MMKQYAPLNLRILEEEYRVKQYGRGADTLENWALDYGFRLMRELAAARETIKQLRGKKAKAKR